MTGHGAIDANSGPMKIRPLPWWRRVFLRPGLRIVERPLPLQLPDSATALIEALATLHEPGDGPTDGAESPTPFSDKALAELGLQVWRLRKRVERIDPKERRKERRQFEESTRRLEQLLVAADVVVDDPIGRPYVEGWVEIEVLAWEPVEEGDERPSVAGPWVKDTVKPIIRRDGKVISQGQVIVARP